MSDECGSGAGCLYQVALIEAQAERIKLLREALSLIRGQTGEDYAHDIFEARAIARTALEKTK